MNEENVSIRLKVAIQDLGITASEFAEKCGISRATLSQLLTGRNKKISDVIISQIHAAYPDLSIMWLLFNEGEAWPHQKPVGGGMPDSSGGSEYDNLQTTSPSRQYSTSISQAAPAGDDGLGMDDGSSLFDFDEEWTELAGAGVNQPLKGMKNASENPEIPSPGQSEGKYSKENGLKAVCECIKNVVHEEINNCLKSGEFFNKIGNLSKKCKKISHITVYYDDSTFETFYPKQKSPN